LIGFRGGMVPTRCGIEGRAGKIFPFDIYTNRRY
jgi:hypothetical protein